MEQHPQDEELKAHLLATNSEFRTLAEQHAQLKHEIEAIESKPHVTGDDEIVEHRLKKLKLHIKDQMNSLLAVSRQVTVS
ncbi:MAG TPA: YdcH family protein [Bryobacteraceae bacterium]|nr:YdcH family protein [Bryobacteraceae bacterium]